MLSGVAHAFILSLLTLMSHPGWTRQDPPHVFLKTCQAQFLLDLLLRPLKKSPAPLVMCGNPGSAGYPMRRTSSLPL